MVMGRICLVTQSHPSLNPRLVKEADALAEAGYVVSVIAPDYSPWAHEADEEFRNRSWAIVARPQFGPHAGVKSRVSEAIRRLVFGAIHRLKISASPVVIRNVWHPAAPLLVTAARRHEADIYIAHYPAALPAAALSANAHGGRYAFDAEDFHPGDLPDGSAHDRARALIRSIESEYLPGCAYVTAAAPGIADAYADAYPISHPTVLLNTFPLAQAPVGPTPRGKTRPGPSVYWFSQTIGPDRGLECAVRAIGLARTHPHLYLRGNPQHGFIERLQDIAADAGATNRLHVLPLASPSSMVSLAAAFDLGLVGETGRTLNRRIALTNKLFTYALAGLPAVISDIPAHRNFAESAGNAVRLYATEDSARLAAALDELLGGDGTALAKARAEAYALGQARLNWETEKPKLLRLVDEALS